MTDSNVENPKHYNNHPSGIEAIELMRPMHQNFAQAFKYAYRAGFKGEVVEDLEKAMWYMEDFLKKCTGSKSENLFASGGVIAHMAILVLVADNHDMRRKVLAYLMVGAAELSRVCLMDWLEFERSKKGV